ncbi:hypothetical protein Hanom_Chr13g01229761 [Helianthus anomalus]
MRVADKTRGIDMNRLKERSIQVQRLADTLKEKHDDMKEWYNIRNNKITDGVKRITDGFEFLRKRDHDSEDPGNPNPSATFEQPPATSSTEIVVFQPSQLESAQGTSGGTVEEVQQMESSSYIESSMAGTSSVPSSVDIALQALHLVTGEVLEEGEIVVDLSHKHLLALNEMKIVEDSVIDQMPIEQETDDTENIDEIVFEGETSKSTYVRVDGMEFNPFDEEWKKENQEDIDEQLKNRTSSNNPTDSFQEWRKRFLSKVEKPTPLETQVDFLKKSSAWPSNVNTVFNISGHC